MRFLSCVLWSFFSLPSVLCGSGGSQGGGSSFTPYSPTGLGGADTSWQSLLNQQIGAVNSPAEQFMQSQLAPLYGQLVGNIGNAAPGIETTAGQAAGYYGNMASQADAFHNLMSDQGTADYAAAGNLDKQGNAVMNTAMDPQQALYKQMLQQTNDQANAATSMRGIGTGAEAAGIQNQADQNFNIGWENQQLQRQLSGLQGLGAANTQAGQLGQAGSNQLSGSQAMSALAPQLLMQGAELPYQTTAGLLNAGFQNAGTYANAMSSDQLGPLAGIMGEILPYMNYGMGAQANQFNAGQANLSNLSSLGGLLTNDLGTGTGGFSNSPFGYLSSLFGNPFGGGAAAASPWVSGFDLAGGGAAEQAALDAAGIFL